MVMLAVGLAMDAMAVAAARGVAVARVRVRDVVLVACLFGGFQALMPLLGWVAGSWLGPSIAAWDHWIAFVLLSGIGAKMLWEARGDVEAQETEDALGLRVLFGLAIATSIDAFAAGITLPMMGAAVGPTVATIGAITALLSALGLFVGRKLGAMVGRKLDALGGVILIGLGLKTLLQHLIA